MSNPLLKIKAKLQILKPVQEVYDAIIDDNKMSNYFIADSSGPLESGKTVIWHFPEFDVDIPVRVVKTEPNNYISFYWDSETGKEMLVEITLAPSGGNTVVTVTEKSQENNEAGIKWLKSNTEGWANFLACLKAYLEYGINLRKGAFDFMSEKK
jgi:uncharacterized protein YndB with AHSA1/START domain